ncbi:MAG TPA: dicarboxylate/amino acid:cation symporter [Acidobacteriota bacterium]
MKSRWILLGLGLGFFAGLGSNLLWEGSPGLVWAVRNLADPVGELFLRLIFLTIPTLAFSALALGVAGFQDLFSLGRIAVKTLIYTAVVSSLAVLLGLALVNLVRPGLWIDAATREQLIAISQPAETEADSKSVFLQIVQLIPDPLQWMGPKGILILIGGALLFGIVLCLLRKERVGVILKLLERLLWISTGFLSGAMWLAPLGIAALVFRITASFGLELLGSLASFALVVIGGLALHQFGTYSLILRCFAGVSPREFFRSIREVMATAFATSSSNATLPTALRVGEQNLGLPPQISRFVLTGGATANQNGTALYEGVTLLFLAQLYLGRSLPLADQLYVVGMAILAGIGTAGVPAGSIPFIRAIGSTVGLPATAVGTILGLDRILDMCRTVLNVTGDLVCATYIARSEARRRAKSLRG